MTGRIQHDNGVTHLSTNRARRRLTSSMRPPPLPAGPPRPPHVRVRQTSINQRPLKNCRANTATRMTTDRERERERERERRASRRQVVWLWVRRSTGSGLRRQVVEHTREQMDLRRQNVHQKRAGQRPSVRLSACPTACPPAGPIVYMRASAHSTD